MIVTILTILMWWPGSRPITVRFLFPQIWWGKGEGGNFPKIEQNRTKQNTDHFLIRMKSKPQCAPNLDHYNQIRHLPDLYEKFSTFWSLQHFQSIIKINAQKDQFSAFVFPFLVKFRLLDKDANPFQTNFSKKSISGQKSGKSDHFGQIPQHNDLPSRHSPNSIWTPERIPTDTLRKLTHHSDTIH